jgi:acetyl esterase/lipase
MSEKSFTVSDVPYQSKAGEPVLARIYRPEGEGPFPAIVDVHGGAWRANDRTRNARIDGYLAARGVLVIALDFGLAPAATYPEPVADVNLGIRWAKSQAATLGFDPSRLGAYGSSSGGHLLLLNVLRPDDPRYAALPLAGAEADAALAFAIACWPVAEPLARYEYALEAPYQSLVDAHHLFWKDRAEMAEGSPLLILEQGHAGRLPPLLVIQGTADDNVPFELAQRLEAAYRAAGGDARLELFEGQPHAFANDPREAEAGERALAMMKAFVDRFG